MERLDMVDGDDDGKVRTGTVWTATTHAITSIIGSGVLALPWSVAQMGWIIGPIALVLCAFVTYYTAILLCDCYRTPDPVKGRRNHTYMDVVRSCLGPRDVFICGIVQYIALTGALIGYTIAAATSMMAVVRSNCFHNKGHNANCTASGTMYMIIFGILEIPLSQFPNLEKITVISVIAALMSLTYSFVALFLSIEKFASNHFVRGSILGVKVGGVYGVSSSTKVWHSLQALGNIALAYTYAVLLIEIQDTLKSQPPENKTMKKASLYAIGVTTLFYVSLGCIGYAAFGNGAPGNVLTGFYEPFWLVDIANVAVLIHMIGAYQVFAQPVFAMYENWLANRWPDSPFFHSTYSVKLPFTNGRAFRFMLCKLVLRTIFVMILTLISLMLPFFNAILALLGSLAFWPLTVYYPVTVYMAQTKIKQRETKWWLLQALSMAALVVSLLAAVGSVADIVQRLKNVKVFVVEL